MKKKSKNLTFEKNFRVMSSKHGGFLNIYVDDKCLTIAATKILKQVLISLYIQEREKNIKDNEAA